MKYLPLLAISLVMGLLACTAKPVLKHINVKEAVTLLASDANTLQIVDLRTPGEVQETGMLPGAELINFMSADFEQKIGQLDKKRPLLLYCASGSRSAQAAELLHKEGFLTVYDLAPGMSGWLASNQKTTKNK